MEHKIHQGRNVKRFREMLGIKQEALAFDLGDDWNQKKVSLLEQKEIIEDPLLKRISEVLKIPVEAFQNFDEEQAVNIISNTFNIEKDAYIGNSQPTFNINPIEEIKKLHEEKIALYERMLKEKDDMMGRLEKLMDKK
ncbi:helix-turn-helix domain-containing protein [Elizabethkingia meningoseptica]|uniref:helix-turn-helix domain-containing protein n=1 Tax=Elizabethkingia meningoseptica TaxID=238 RepID=UPI000935E6FA|nr:helix-turn-helix transcriptional regulator [Elizabethkingia meningoseptica]EJK5330083.1 helix-turn-helix transcriptional regulator [Elizabethkingia meningoseptica]MDE5466504.1 helix-turn-helix domain-containing protein [Elizabethkingia meningoseptica]MDE5474266.1 helix-turn-helix domain-containing protein [Elizabethkingia meningoseptica]MDE5477699.1 helix-turn-helix domain-containing protein [Elizabethkingia meningoseptica]MDE5483823.1 helix-turn-helix domain-containing protein [Elizabethki